MFSHPDVDSLSAEQVEQKITQGKARSALLESVFRNPKFLRFLYDRTGDSEEKHDTTAAFLSAHGYRLAPCTIDNTDYKFDETKVLDPARQLARTYAAASLRVGSAFSISLVLSNNTRTKVHSLQCRRSHLACDQGEIRAPDSYPCLFLICDPGRRDTERYQGSWDRHRALLSLFGINYSCTLLNGQTVPVFPARSLEQVRLVGQSPPEVVNEVGFTSGTYIVENGLELRNGPNLLICPELHSSQAIFLPVSWLRQSQSKSDDMSR